MNKNMTDSQNKETAPKQEGVGNDDADLIDGVAYEVLCILGEAEACQTIKEWDSKRVVSLWQYCHGRVESINAHNLRTNNRYGAILYPDAWIIKNMDKFLLTDFLNWERTVAMQEKMDRLKRGEKERENERVKEQSEKGVGVEKGKVIQLKSAMGQWPPYKKA